MSDNKTVKAATAAKKPVIVMYIGPSIKGVVAYGTIFNNGITEELRAEIEKIPAVGGLIVPTTQLAAASADVEREGSAYNVLYHKVEEKLKKRKE